jgi:hypothetical protein
VPATYSLEAHERTLNDTIGNLTIGRFILNIAAQWMDLNSSLENIKVNL